MINAKIVRQVRVFSKVFMLLTVTSFLFRSTLAVPGPTLDLDGLTKDSEVIVVGEVESLQNVRSTVIENQPASISAKVLNASIRVSGTLKGPSESEHLMIQFVEPENFIGWQSVPEHTYAMYFLKQNSGRPFSFTEPFHRFLNAVPGVTPLGTTAIGRVVNQLGGVIASPKTSTGQKQTAIFDLSRSSSPISTSVLRLSLQSSEQEVKLSAAGALLQRNDISALTIATDALLSNSGIISEVLRHNLCYGISEGVKDPKSVQDLRRLLASPDTQVRKAAASALRHTRADDALNPLATLLDDPDQEIRYYSVIGLAEITGQTDWRPNRDVFLASQQKYLTYWRNWARNR